MPILFEANLMLVMRMIVCTNIHAALQKLFLRLTLLSDQTRKHFKLYNRGRWLSTTVSSVLLRKKIADVERQVWWWVQGALYNVVQVYDVEVQSDGMSTFHLQCYSTCHSFRNSFPVYLLAQVTALGDLQYISQQCTVFCRGNIQMNCTRKFYGSWDRPRHRLNPCHGISCFG